MMILAIDPGPIESAYVYLRDGSPSTFGKYPNAEIFPLLNDLRPHPVPVYIEMIASYGMAVGAEVFETCVWIGRFLQAAGAERCTRITRKQVTLSVCRSAAAGDSNVRQALIDRYGPGKAKAIGLKASPGPLYGMKADCWAALALAVTAYDRATA